MKRFALYYKKARTSHSRFQCVIKAENSRAAFKEAISVMRTIGLDPDQLKEFYVAPLDIDRSVGYRRQCHGWDDYGDFPRD
jgi:hypothetical protein